jgi:hypothetical protein
MRPAGNSNSLQPFYWKKSLLWLFSVAGKEVLESLCKVVDILSDFNQRWIFLTDLFL